MSNTTASADSSESPTTDIPNSQATYSMHRIRLESIERRRQECTDIIKERKRKLSELYCVSRLPFMPISNDQILQIEDKLMAFLEKNDLENGHEFNIAALSKEKQYRKSHSPQPQQQQLNKNNSSSPSPSFPYSPSPINQDKASDSLLDNNNTTDEPPRKLQKLPPQKSARTAAALSEETINDQALTQPLQSNDKVDEGSQKEIHVSKNQQQLTKSLLPAKSESVIITRRHLESSPDEPPTLSSLIHSYSNDRLPKRSDECSSRDIDIDNIDIKKLMVTLMPESKPHKVAEARSLTELYYHQQTLQLPKLLLRAHKTLTTDAFETSLVEGKVSVLHSRIEELKRKNSWSLRQPKKFIDPFLKLFTKKVHWDYLLSESKWISIDMKEERRYKLTQCVFVAQAIQDYWTYGSVCCIKRAKIIHLDQTKVDEPIVEITESQDGKFNETEPEKEGKETKITVKIENTEECQRKDENSLEGSGIDDDFIISKEDVEKMDVDNVESSASKASTDRFDFSEISTKKLPEFSYEKFINATKDRVIPFKVYANMEIFTATEKAIVSHLHEYLPFNDKEADHVIDMETYGHISAMIPPFDEEPEYEKLIFRKFDDNDKHPYSHQSGLFGPFRRINILKPPRPPSIKNLELRIPTIWLPQDDKYLIKYVTEFSFNWDIIAAHLSAKPTRSYTSNIERRTPWQCFERYIQLNDKFQFTDMRGTFAISAKEWLEAAHQAQATTKRRISPLGVGTESIQRGNRRLRWGSMFEAMRKLMKKRENTQKTPTQHRKTNHEATRSDTPTPEQLSKLKFDRDRALQEAYAQQNPSAGYQRMRVPVSTRQMAATVTTGGRLPDSTRVAFQGSPQATMTQASQQAALQQRSQSQRMHSPQSQGTSGSTLASQVVLPAANSAVGIGMTSSKISRPTTPNGTQLTPDQIQRLLNLQRQKQLAQQQSHRQAMMLQQQQQQQLQQQLKGESIAKQQTTSSAPVSSSGTPQLQTSQLLAQAKILAQGRSPSTPPKQISNTSTDPIINHSLSSAASTPSVSRAPSRVINKSQNGGIVPTPEQVLQNAIKSSNSPNANSSTQMSPTPPPAKIQRNQTHPVSKQPRPTAKFTFTHAQISAIVNQIQAQNPTLPKEQVTKLATSYLAKLQQKSVQMQKQQTTPGSNQIQQQGPSSKFTPSPKIPSAQISVNNNQSIAAMKQPNKQPQQLTLQQLTTLINNPKLNPQQKKHLQVIRQRQLEEQRRVLEQQKQNIQPQESQQSHQIQRQSQPHQLQRQQQQQQRQLEQQRRISEQQKQNNQLQESQQPQQRASAVQNPIMANASPQRKDVTGKTNSPSITTRFSPQTGSSVNINYYRKANSPSGSPVPSRVTTPSLAVEMNQGKVNAPLSSDASTVTAPATGYDNSTGDDLNDLNKLDELFGLHPENNGDKSN